MELAETARELYGLLPGEFTAARNAKAKEAGKDGNKDLAQRLRGLPKPTTAAWLLNMMARHRRAEIDGVIELGAAMSQAQQDLDPGQMRALGDQRRELLSAMAASGRDLADELGHAVSTAVVTEVEQTLRAAMSDAAAGAALASGLLIDSFSSTGLDPVDLEGLVAVPEAVGSPAPAPPPRRSANKPQRDELAERRTAKAERAAKQEAEAAERRRKQAQAAVDKAEERKEDAEAQEQQVLDRLDQLQNQRDELAGEVAGLKQRIEDLEREIASTDRKMEAAEEDLVSAAKTAARTRKAVAAARRELDEQD